MYTSCLNKQDEIKRLFSGCKSEEDKYTRIIDLGRAQPKLEGKDKIPENVVKGCQSTMYMKSEFVDGVMKFAAESDALISSGLAALLVKVYSGESPEAILKCPPTYLEELGISAALTPNRANGLFSIHLRMKQEALKAILSSPKQQ